MYHTSIPLTFQVELPDHLFGATNSTYCTDPENCMLGQAVAAIFGHKQDDVRDFGIVSRQERFWNLVAAGVGGFILRPVLAKVFPNRS